MGWNIFTISQVLDEDKKNDKRQGWDAKTLSISLERISSCSTTRLCVSCLSCQHTFKGPAFTLVLTLWMKSTKKLSLTTDLTSTQILTKLLQVCIKQDKTSQSGKPTFDLFLSLYLIPLFIIFPFPAGWQLNLLLSIKLFYYFLK